MRYTPYTHQRVEKRRFPFFLVQEILNNIEAAREGELSSRKNNTKGRRETGSQEENDTISSKEGSHALKNMFDGLLFFYNHNNFNGLLFMTHTRVTANNLLPNYSAQLAARKF